MARLTQSTKATTTVVETVNLKPTARQMLLARFEEYGKLAAVVLEAKGTKKKPGRMRRIADEVAEIFRREKQGKALRNGCKVGDVGVKLVAGTRSVFDKVGFMKKHGLTQADFDEFTETADNEPYVRITLPGLEEE